VQPDGTVRYVWDRGFPLRDESGEVYRLAGVVIDITERKEAEEAVQDGRSSKIELTVRCDEGAAYGLTFRELQVVRLVAEGQSDKEIAMVLGLRRKTVSKHLENILDKMGCSSRTEVVARSVREGLVD
jgi:DNA-binding NarL/FixJ family response regulator